MVGSGVSDTDDHHWYAYGEGCCHYTEDDSVCHNHHGDGEDYHDGQQGGHTTEPSLITMAV